MQGNIKDFFKKIAVVEYINSKVKAKQVERQYLNWCDYYEGIRSDKTFHSLCLEKKLYEILKFNNDRIKVIFCGTDYMQDYGGFVQSLKKYCDLKIFHQIDGTYGQDFSSNAHLKNYDSLVSFLDKLETENWKPDILLMQSMGLSFDPENILKLKSQYHFSVVNIGMDERLAYKIKTNTDKEMGIAGLNPAVDLMLVTTPECADWYIKEGVAAKYFPLASDSSIYYPCGTIIKKYDVGFIGRCYGERKKIINRLSKRGIEVKAYGPGWEAGTLPISENNNFYNSCKIVLGTGNIGYSQKLMNPKLRDFEVPLTSSLYITNYTEELNSLFEDGKEIVLYKTEDELFEKLNYYLKNPSQCLEIGQNGYRKVYEKHLYDHRFEILFNQVLRGNLDVEFI